MCCWEAGKAVGGEEGRGRRGGGGGGRNSRQDGGRGRQVLVLYNPSTTRLKKMKIGVVDGMVINIT